MTASSSRPTRLLGAGLVLVTLGLGAMALWPKQTPAASAPALQALSQLIPQETLPAGSRWTTVDLHRDLRPSLVVPAPATVEVPLPNLAWDELHVSVGARRSTPNEPAASVTFELSAQVASKDWVLLQRYSADIPEGSTDSHWSDLRVDLGPFLGQATRLRLRALGDQPHLRALWGAASLCDSRRKVPQDRPNVILISVDTLAANHLSLYGYGRATSPELEAFAQDAVTFEQAISHQSWTLTAHASLLTSLLPDTHGVSMGTSLAPEHRLLPEWLRDLGYYTAGVVNNPYLNPKFGYGRAYHRYHFDHELRDSSGQRVKRSIEQSHSLLKRWSLPDLPQPFFLLDHVIDAHSDWRSLPYEAPAPFGTRFVEPHMPAALPPDQGPYGSSHLARVNRGETSWSTAQADYAAALYDGGLAYVDHQLGRFFEELRSQGLYRDALIILTSDHGEEFLEHGKLMHTQGYDECLRVPLLIKFPNGRWGGRRIARQVQHVDVLPTILNELQVDAPPGLEGTALQPIILGAEHPRDWAIAKAENFSMTPQDVYVARSEDWKLIWTPGTGEARLYDLARDPEERHDLAAQQPETRAALIAKLAAHRQARDLGFHLRIPPYAGSGQLRIQLDSDAPLQRLRRYDQNAEGRQAAPEISEDGRSVAWTLQPRRLQWTKPLGLDFDLEPGARCTLRVTQEGLPIPSGQVRLGAGWRQAGSLPLIFPRGSPELGVAPEEWTAFAEESQAPTLYLWEARPSQGQSVEWTAGERQALEALGYSGDD